MNSLGARPTRSKAKLCKTKAVVEMCRQSFLKEGNIDFIHSISEGDRPIVGEEFCVLLIIFY